MRNLFISLLLLVVCHGVAVRAEVPREQVRVEHAGDLRALAQESRRSGRPILIEVAMDYCPYCARVEDEFLEPMLMTDYDRERVIIRRIELGTTTGLTDFDGRPLTGQAFADRYGVTLVPTVLLLDAHGREVAERLEGLLTPDFYGGYLEAAIDDARGRIRAEPPG